MLKFITNNFWLSLILANYIIALITAAFVVLHNRDPTKTVSFILALIVLPFIGIFIYFFFGQEYRKSKIFKRRYVAGHKKIKEWERKLLFEDIEIGEIRHREVRKMLRVVNLIQNNQRAPVTFYNDVKLLINGEVKIRHLIEDIKRAKHHIHLEYYIFNSDVLGNRLIELLCEKSREGVSVKISYDYVASEMSSQAISKMKKAGIEIFAFMPVWFPNLTRKLNYRDHKKIVIIDGDIGYVGGVNLCQSYINGKDSKHFWRDTHLRIEGHAVKSLQTQFLYTWDFVNPEDFEILRSYYPETRIKKKMAVQIAASGPDTDFPNIMESIFVAISSAEKFIYITTPYFIPNEEILMALCTSSRSGVTVKIIVPEIGDTWAARYATNSYIERLLESGIEVYHYCKGMVHAKTMVVDGILGTVGTCNMDNRSFNLNFEVNALIYDSEFCREMIENFNEDIAQCNVLDLDQWNQRWVGEKIKESLCRLWAPLL